MPSEALLAKSTGWGARDTEEIDEAGPPCVPMEALFFSSKNGGGGIAT